MMLNVINSFFHAMPLVHIRLLPAMLPEGVQGIIEYAQ